MRLGCHGLFRGHRDRCRCLTGAPNQQKGGQRSWWAFIFMTSLGAVVIGSVCGLINYTMFTRKYYNYISLRKVVDVDPAQWQGQQVLDAGEIDFRAGTRIDRSLNMMYHKGKTWCVAPIVPADDF